MADEAALRGLLDRANVVFLTSHDLGTKFEREIQSGGNSDGTDGLPKVRYRQEIEALINAIAACRDLIADTPPGLQEVTELLRYAGRVAQAIRQEDTHASIEIWGLFPDLNQIGYAGYMATKAVVAANRLDDPLAFLDAPNEAPGPEQPALPAPASDRATVRWLVEQLDGAEFYRGKADEAKDKITGPPVVGTRDSHYLRVQIAHGRQSDEYRQRLLGKAGSAELRALFDARGVPWSVEGLRGLRGRLVETTGASPAEVDAMGLIEFGDAIRSELAQAPVDTAAHETASGSGANGAGYLGGADLKTHLRIAPSRGAAFDKAIERARHEIGDSNWIEVSNPGRNTPKYLYKAAALESLAAKYRSDS